MSRSIHRKVSRHFRPGWRVTRIAQTRSQRHAVDTAQRQRAREVRVTDAALEVLADFHEQHGRLRLAEWLRRGVEDDS